MFRSVARAERRPRRLPLMAAVCALLVASHVRADAVDRLELSWVAPPGCPRGADVRARIRKLTGQTPTTGAAIQAEASVVRAPSGRLHLTLVVRTGDSVGQREIEANACEDLAGATAVNLALLLRSSSPLTAAGSEQASQPSADTARDQAAASTTATPNQQNAEPSEASRSSPSAPSATPAPPKHAARGWRGLVRLPLMAASIGVLPSASWGAALAIGVQVEHWNILIDGSAWLRQSLAAPHVLDVGAHIDRMELGLWACHGFSLGVLELAPCAGLSLQHIWTRGSGARIQARTAQATWLAPGIGAQTRWSLTRWLNLVATADVRAQTARPSIVVDGVGWIGQTGPLAIGFLLGSEWIL